MPACELREILDGSDRCVTWLAQAHAPHSHVQAPSSATFALSQLHTIRLRHFHTPVTPADVPHPSDPLPCEVVFATLFGVRGAGAMLQPPALVCSPGLAD